MMQNRTKQALVGTCVLFILLSFTVPIVVFISHVAYESANLTVVDRLLYYTSKYGPEISHRWAFYNSTHDFFCATLTSGSYICNATRRFHA